MSQEREDQERPCLHRMIVELIDDFFAEHPATAGSDKVDTAEADEVIDAIAKTVAELTSQQNGLIRQQLIEQLIALRLGIAAGATPRRGIDLSQRDFPNRSHLALRPRVTSGSRTLFISATRICIAVLPERSSLTTTPMRRTD